jgi:hypothetical protein
MIPLYNNQPRKKTGQGMITLVKLLLLTVIITIFSSVQMITKGDTVKFYGAVVTLPRDTARYDDFKTRWSIVWPDLHITKQLCFKNSPKLRSLGVFACFYQAVAVFLDSPGHEQYDYILLFEDDGVPFPDVQFPEEIEKRIQHYPDIEMMVLGGHAVIGTGKKSLTGDELLFKAKDSSGAYAFMIKASTAERFMVEVEKELARKRDSTSGFDHYIWKIYKGTGRIAVPLLVDHRHGESNTWGTHTPTRKFEGRRDFWNFVD